MADRYWVGGTGTWNDTNTANWSATNGGAGGASVPISTDNIYFTSASSSGSYDVYLYPSALTFTAGAILSFAAPASGALAFYLRDSGNTTSTVLYTSNTSTTTVAATNVNIIGTVYMGGSWNANGATLSIFAVINLTVSLAGDIRTADITQLNSSILNLNSYTFTAANYLQSGTGSKTINFGTGKFVFTGVNNTLWNYPTTTLLTITGSKNIELTTNATTGTRYIVHGTTGGTEAKSINVAVKAGSDTIAGSGATAIQLGNLDFTGFSGTFANSNYAIYGSLTLSPTMTLANTTYGFKLWGTGTTYLTTNGKTVNTNIFIAGGTSSSVILADDLTTTVLVTHTLGGLNTNGKTVSMTGGYTSTGTATRALTLGTSTVTCNAFGIATSTNYTLSAANSILNLTGTTNTLGNTNLTFGTINITGSTVGLSVAGGTAVTIATLANTVSPSTITFSSSYTYNISNFNVSGTSGNLVAIKSTAAGTRSTLNKTSGTVDANYLDIKDSNATGGATWNAYNSVDSGNNLGWNFAILSTSNMFQMFW